MPICVCKNKEEVMNLRDGRVTGLGVAGGREKNRNDIKAVLMRISKKLKHFN